MKQKYTDDYNAKLKIWAANPKVHPLPVLTNLPPFRSKKFDTQEEYKQWWSAYKARIVTEGGLKWTKSSKN